MQAILYEILADISGRKGMISNNGYDDATSLRRDLGFDSFDLAELTVRLEDCTAIDIFEENILVDTVGDICRILNSGRAL